MQSPQRFRDRRRTATVQSRIHRARGATSIPWPVPTTTKRTPLPAQTACDRLLRRFQRQRDNTQCQAASPATNQAAVSPQQRGDHPAMQVRNVRRFVGARWTSSTWISDECCQWIHRAPRERKCDASLLMRTRIGGCDAKTRSQTFARSARGAAASHSRIAAKSWLPNPSCAARRSA